MVWVEMGVGGGGGGLDGGAGRHGWWGCSWRPLQTAASAAPAPPAAAAAGCCQADRPPSTCPGAPQPPASDQPSGFNQPAKQKDCPQVGH